MRRFIAKLLYWLTVLVISLALLVILVLFFESRDAPEIEGAVLLLGGVGAGAGLA